jgi:NAD(P)-dependent dehydrogenase (short-subunit alcohol dehydrogenase family)
MLLAQSMSARRPGTVVVVGAGSGIGRAVVRRFAAEGWQAALVGRRAAALQETVSLLAVEAQRRCAAFSCDAGRSESVDAMAAGVFSRFGRVDVLVYCAGINVRDRSFERLARDDWRRLLATNLDGAFYCVQAFLPAMRESGGTIVTINSDAGRLARDLAGPAYVASKFGLAGLTQQINLEERAHGVRATSIFPRDVNTPLLDQRPAPPPADLRARMIQPEDVAACVWLAATLPARVVVDEIALSTR